MEWQKRTVGIMTHLRREACLFGLFWEGSRMFPAASGVWKIFTDFLLWKNHPVYKAWQEANTHKITQQFLFFDCWGKTAASELLCNVGVNPIQFIKTHTKLSIWRPDTNIAGSCSISCPWFNHQFKRAERHTSACCFCVSWHSFGLLFLDWREILVTSLSQGQTSHGFMAEVNLSFINLSSSASS